MALTLGPAPLGRHPGGAANFTIDGPAHRLWWEPSPRRVRAQVAGQTVVDTRAAKLLQETGLMPVYYLPREDVRTDLLEPSGTTTTCPFKGEARYWTLRAGDATVPDLAWEYPAPIAGAPPLAGHLALFFDKVDAWYEEDEQFFVHPRDPYHRVDAIPSSRHVEVRDADGELLAASARPVLVFETGLPTRAYLPRADVRTELLGPSPTATRCPYKGLASYLQRDGRDVAWSYLEPFDGLARVAGHVCFFDDRVAVTIDGERLGGS